MNAIDPKLLALSSFLDCKPSDIEPITWNNNYFNHDGNEYQVLTEEQADEIVRDEILSSLWAFNTNFLKSFVDVGEDALNALGKIRDDVCEGLNSVYLALIKDKDAFVKAAIDADGRGHFMSCYDGDEHTVKVGSVEYRIYRMS